MPQMEVEYQSPCCPLRSFGLKPSRGRVSSGPDLGEALGGMAISHCLSKSVRDSAALLDISSELMPGEPYVSPKQNGKFLDSIHIEPKNLKIDS
ncbi:MAG: hypothetical protein CM15mP73_1050 [Hyphomicrobiales bacterium]|nr:MAG: hypothetical protein CM15mP73_1050 [Hyphomicrobiales bacterium]